MKKPKKVQAPEVYSICLTPGKIYDVVGFWINGAGACGYRFKIMSDNNDELLCRENECSHLNGGNWIIVETES